MQDIIFIGSGGCMRELLWQVEELNRKIPTWRVLGYVDKEPCRDRLDGAVSAGSLQIPYLGNDDVLLSLTEDTNVAMTVGEPWLRKKIVTKLVSNPHIQFPNLILEDARICSDVKMGQGCIISMDCRISTNVRLGEFVFFNIGAKICHDGNVGDYTTLGPDVTLAGHVTVGAESSLGLGTKVIQERILGDRVTTGAGSVVVRDVMSGKKIMGVPAREIR